MVSVVKPARGDVLAEARDNAGFGTSDEHHGLPTPADAAPDGDRPALDVWRDGLLSFPTADKVAIALELERAVLGLDSRIRGVRSSNFGDSAVEMAVANSLGVEAVVDFARRAGIEATAPMTDMLVPPVLGW